MATTGIQKRQAAQLAEAPGAAISDKLVGRLAQRFGVPATGLLKTLRDTFFVPPKKDDRPFSNEEMAAALVVCEKYGLNPFAKQIYVTRNRGMLLVIVPIDGWAKIVNEKEDYDGVEFDYANDKDGLPYSVTCRIFRRGKSRPTEITEFYEECYAPKSDHPSDPWKKWPRRMLRHKAFIQTARIAYALSDVVDDDEAAHYVDAADYTVRETLPAPPKQPKRRAPREVMADPVTKIPFDEDVPSKKKRTVPDERRDPVTIAPSPEPPSDDSARVNLDGTPVQHLPTEEGTISTSEEARAYDKKIFDVEWKRWSEIRRDIDGPSMVKIRKELGIGLIDRKCSVDEIRAAIALAEELKI